MDSGRASFQAVGAGCLEPVILQVLEVHPFELLGPIHGIDAAGAGLDGEDGSSRVVRIPEQRLAIEDLQAFLKTWKTFLDFAQEILVGLLIRNGYEIETMREVGFQGSKGIDQFSDRLLLGDETLSSVRVDPQVW